MTTRYIQKTVPKLPKVKTEKLEILVQGKLKALLETLLSPEGKEKIEVTSLILNVSLVSKDKHQTLMASEYKIICEEKE